MRTLTPDEFLELFQYLGYSVNRLEKNKPLNLNIVGVRGSTSRVNYFDDSINIYYEDDLGWNHYTYEATTSPGEPALLNLTNKEGTAILKAGQYLYQKGLHKGQYEALVQKGPVTVYRDSNKDLVYDKDARYLESGFFGINIHKASLFSKFVGPDSSGCQVIKSGFDSFMDLINESLKFRENKFVYTLVEV